MIVGNILQAFLLVVKDHKDITKDKPLTILSIVWTTRFLRSAGVWLFDGFLLLRLAELVTILIVSSVVVGAIQLWPARPESFHCISSFFTD